MEPGPASERISQSWRWGSLFLKSSASLISSGRRRSRIGRFGRIGLQSSRICLSDFSQEASSDIQHICFICLPNKTFIYVELVKISMRSIESCPVLVTPGVITTFEADSFRTRGLDAAFVASFLRSLRYNA